MSQPLTKLGGVCAATGIAAPMLSRWIDRRTVKLSRSDGVTTGSGSHRVFSRNTVIQIAIAKVLVDLGIGPGRANRASAVFVDGSHPDRPPGMLFPFNSTLLIVSADSSRVVNGQFSSTVPDLLGRPAVSSIIIDLSPIVRNVDRALEENDRT